MALMSFTTLGTKCGVTSTTLDELIKGRVSTSVGSRIGATSSSLQTFVDGGPSTGLAQRMGITSTSLQELRKAIGKEGAIGLLIGLMHEK
jgi:hypothetical protein